MRGHYALFVLLFAVSFVAAQFPAVPITPLEKALSLGTTITNQQLPPCSTVDYVVPSSSYFGSSGTQISASVFFLKFFLSQSTSTVTVGLLYRSGTTGVATPIPITSQFVGAVGGTTYDDCNPGTNSISAVDEETCGINYYCSSTIRQLANVTNVQLIVRVTTTYAESEPGIIFDLTLTQRVIPVTITQLGTRFTTSNIVSPVGVPEFVPSINQVLYYVQLKPATTDRIGVATYLAQSSYLTQVQFRLSNISVSGLADTEDWSLAINEGALAVINFVGTQTTFDCSSVENITRTVSSLSDDVVIRIPSCDNLYTEYFISVAIPADSQAWTYSLTTSFVGSGNPQDFSTYVPTFVTISSSNTIVPSIVGNGYSNYYYDLPYQANFFFLNIQSTTDSLTNMVVSIFGITRSRIWAQLTKNTLGLGGNCNNAADLVDTCRNYDEFIELYPRDYCKMTVTNCEFSSSNYYFLSVTNTGSTFGQYQYYYGVDYEEYEYLQAPSSYSVLVQVSTINPIVIPSLLGSVVDGFTVFTDINSVANQAYNHYVYPLTSAMITPTTHIRVEFYTVNEQTPVTLYMNYNSFAGNVAQGFDNVYDQEYENLYYNQPQNSQCLSAIWSCTTVTNRNSYYDSINTCFRNIPYCDLIANNAQSIYFSVYGAYVSGVDNPKGFSNYEGYNRSVSYTLKVSYRDTPELLFDRITNVQHLPRTYQSYDIFPLETAANGAVSFSHQFMFSVPKSSSQSVISQVRFRLHDFYKNCYDDEEVFMYLQCNNPAGECPCYLSQQFCEIDDEEQQYCDVASNLCSCPTGNFYISVLARHDGGYKCQRPYTYQITPFLVSAPIADTIYTNELGVNNVVTYSDVFFQNIPFDLTGYVGQNLGYYYFPSYYSLSQQVYQIINNGESTTDILNVRVKYAHIDKVDPVSFVPIQVSRGVVALDDGCLVAFCTGWKRDITSEYYQPSNGIGPQAYWCQTVVQSCHFTQDVYYIRLFAWGTNFLLEEDSGYSALTKQTIDYTLEISVEDNSPVPLSLNVPLHGFLQTVHYAHYSIDVTSIPSNSWLRISTYLNQDTSKLIQMFLNYDSLAGNDHYYGDCFDYIARCAFGSYRNFNNYPAFYDYYGYVFFESTNSQYCDFYLEPCDIPSTGIIYTSVWGNYVTDAEGLLEYTIIAESQSVIQLNSAMGYPTTGLLLYNQVAYYSFTLDTSDFRPFVIQLQSIEPYPSTVVTGVLETTFSTVIPGTKTTSGACDCTGTYKYDAFTSIIYNCGDLSNQPQYMTIRNTLESYFTPVSYTVRAYYHNRYSMNLNVQSNIQWNQTVFTQIPQSLNYNEVLDVAVSITQLQSSVLYIAVSDISFTNTSENGYDRSLNAYLSFGRPGSPECFTDAVALVNTVIPNPENVLMYAFQIPPCTSCSGTYYLSLYAQFDEPQPLNRLRLNFTVAAWTTQVTTPTNFPSNIRTLALENGGSTFTFAQTNSVVTCDNRFSSSPYFIDYFFVTPSIQTNLYETFDITYSNTGAVSNTDFTISTTNSGCQDCVISSGQSCNVVNACRSTTNNIYYGNFGYSTCSTSSNLTVTGSVSLNFEIDDSQVFTTTTQTINPSSTTNVNISPRVVAQYVVSFTSVDFSTWPVFDLSTSISGNGGVCYSPGSTGVSFPPPTLCPSLCNTQSVTLEPCCYDPTDSYTVTIYNSDTTNTLTGTITATLTPLSLGSEIALTLGNTVPSATSFATPTTGLYKFIRFQLTSSNWNSDSVLVIQVFNAASTGGSRTVYLNYASYPGQSSDSFCLQNVGQLCSTGSGNCNVQLPASGCSSSPLFNGLGTYFLAVVSDTASTASTTNAIIYAQTTNVYTATVTGSVPQISQATNDFYTHFKFAIVRSIGDSSFAALERSYQIRLSYSDSTQDLQLSIHNPWFYPTANVLAGQSTQPIFGSCEYTNDVDWSCTSDSTSETCTVPFCTLSGSNSYIWSQGSNKFVYVSVRNLNSSPSVTPFTITNSIVSLGTMPIDEPIYFVNSISQPTDTIFTTACTTSSSGTSGGCQYTPSSTNTPSTIYFTLPISTLTWKSTDQLLVNFTQISSTAPAFDVFIWTDSQCESDAQNFISTTFCYAESTECWWYFSQEFSSLFKTDSGAGATTPYTFTIYLRVEGINLDTSFNFQSRIVSPFAATTTLTPTNLAYTANLLSWSARQVSFNIITPATSNYNLLVYASASCYDEAPELLISTLNYQWPSFGQAYDTYDGITVLDGTQPSPFVLNSCGIVVGGNNYFTIATSTFETPIHPIAQVQIHFSASLDYAFGEKTVGWNVAENLVTGSSSNTFSFIHIAQGENSGTQVDFALSNCPSCSVKIITPYYRQNLVESTVAAGSLEPNIYTPLSAENVEYISFGNDCTSASCSSADGVYCFTSSNFGTFSISIPPCVFTNGRYFVYVTVPAFVSGTYTTVLNERDYALIRPTIANPQISLVDTIVPGESSSISSFNRYQFYQVVADRQSSFYVKMTITLDFATSGDSIFAYAQPGFQSLFSTQTSTVGTASDSCSQFTCSTSTYNNPCFMYDFLCASPTIDVTTLNYFVGITSDASPCTPIRFTFTVVTRQPEDYRLINNNIPVCDQIETYSIIIPYSGVNPIWQFVPSNAIFYQLDTIGINLQFATLTVNAIQNNLNSALPIEVYFGNLPARCQTGCELGTLSVGESLSSGNQGSVTCGLGSQIWISAFTDSSVLGRTDYQLVASITERPVSSISANSVTTVSGSNTFAITNTGIITSISAVGAVIHGVALSDKPVNVGCVDLAGCPDVRPQCAWLSQATVYNVLVDQIPDLNVDQCGDVIGSTHTLTVSSFTPTVLSETTTYSLASGQWNVFTRTFNVTEQTINSRFRVRISALTNGQNLLNVYVGCNGAIAPGDSSCNYFVASFDTNTDMSSNWITLCNTCTTAFITVVADGCDIDRFQIAIDFEPNYLPSTGTVLTNSWQAGAIQQWATTQSAATNYWSFTSGADGFIHIGIGNVNNTNPSDPPNPILELTVYLKGCVVAQCTTGDSSDDIPSRYDFEDRSCFVNFATPAAGLTYIASVSNPSSFSFYASGAFYRTQAFNSFTDISTGSSTTNYQIQGRARHYYKTTAINSNGLASVVVHLNILDGPRLLLQVADSPDFIFNQNNNQQNYQGWVQSKICPFGECTIEVPTYASHPGVNTLYVWVTPAATNSNDMHDVIEKPTNYRIFSTVGVQNCGPISAAIPRSGFCSNVTVASATGGFWLYRDPSIKAQEANWRYENLIDRCPVPTSQCKTYLNRYSCLMVFRECDAQGFIVSQCRGDCQSAVNVCGPWYINSDLASCDQQFPQYECSNSRYLDSEPCTGDITNTQSSGGYNFGLPGSIITPSPVPPGGQTGGGFNGISPVPSPSNVPITPDQEEPPAGRSPSNDCLISPTPSPATVFIPPSATPTITGVPPSSASSLTMTLSVLLTILSLLWLAL